MTYIDPDRDLRELFSRMKDEDRARAPAFHTRRVKLVPRPIWVRVAMAGATAAMIVVATLKLITQLGPQERATRASVREMQRRVYAGTAWTSPTDFLLNTSTSQLLRVVPTFGPAHWINTDSTSLRMRYRS